MILRGSNYLTRILHPFYSDLNLTYTFLTKLPFTTVFNLRVSKIRVITIEENTIQYHCSNNNGLLKKINIDYVARYAQLSAT